MIVERFGRADRCANCMYNLELPEHVEDDPSGGFFAWYVCGSCGWTWMTGWADS
jgi:hypothetical protein